MVRFDVRQRANAAIIGREIAWFQAVLEQRLRAHAGEAEQNADPVPDPPALPPAAADLSPYAQVVRRFSFSAAERLVLILAYLPHINPGALDPFLIGNQATQRRFTEFGGVTGAAHGGFLPTGETAMFLLAGDDLEARLALHGLFHHDHAFYANDILELNPKSAAEPALSAALSLSRDYVERLTTGADYQPPFSAEFPAQLITTPLAWEDLVLEPAVLEDVLEMVTWAANKDTLLGPWKLAKRLKPGYRSLFYGPPGTGKTLTASLIGQRVGQPVYRIDLSKVVSKYIGETEKNLATLFDHAQHRNWILFFDEADSLFGKRTEQRSSNDRAANQQVSYLLQRIEDFPGLVILASNLRSHMDEAFGRRFQSIILFRMPGPEQRLRLWQDTFENQPFALAPDIDLRKVADSYELSGGSIINVLRYACLKAVVRPDQTVTHQDLLIGIRKELHKDGRSAP